MYQAAEELPLCWWVPEACLDSKVTVQILAAEYSSRTIKQQKTTSGSGSLETAGRAKFHGWQVPLPSLRIGCWALQKQTWGWMCDPRRDGLCYLHSRVASLAPDGGGSLDDLGNQWQFLCLENQQLCSLQFTSREFTSKVKAEEKKCKLCKKWKRSEKKGKHSDVEEYMNKIGDNAFVLKFWKTFIKLSSNSWNKLSVEIVEQNSVFEIEVDHKGGRAHSSL